MPRTSTLTAIAGSWLLALAAPAANAVEANDTYVVSGSARAAETMAAWQTRKGVRSVAGEAARRAPRKAVRYEVKAVAWPTATVKELTFRAAQGGVLHPIGDETLLYVLEGSVAATVAGQRVVLQQGDIASLPSGALTNPDAPRDARVIAWTASSLTPGATPAVVTLQSLPAPAAGPLTLRRYEFPGNSVRAVTMAPGFRTNPNSAKTDSLIYVTQGGMQFMQNGQTFTVSAGDFIREVAGLMHHWDVSGGAGFVTTSALPLGAGPIDPAKATDRPR